VLHPVKIIYFLKPSFEFRCDYDAEQFADSSVPILVVGTKLDLTPTSSSSDSAQRAFNIAEECGADEINLVRKKYLP
jgi:hypothetical protein